MNATPINQPRLEVESPGVSSEAVSSSIEFSNPARLIDNLRNTRIGMKNVLGHLEYDRGANIAVRVNLINTILTVESGSLSADQVNKLIQVRSYIQRQDIQTSSQIERTRNEEYDSLLEDLIDKVLEAKNALDDQRSTVMQDTVGGVTDVMAGGLTSVLNRLNNSPDAAKIAVLAGLGLALMWIANSPKLRKALLWSGAIVGAGLLVKPITGRSISEWADRGIDAAEGVNSNRAYADYFGLDYNDNNARGRVNLLRETFLQDNAFGRRDFKDIVGIYRSSTGTLPRSLFTGTQFRSESRERQPAVMYYAVEAVVEKFGLGSSLHAENEQIRRKYDELMEGGTSWREGILQLLRLDPSSPMHRRAETESVDVGGDYNFNVPQRSVNLNRENLNSIIQNLQGNVSDEYIQSLTRRFENSTDEIINTAFNRVSLNIDSFDSYLNHILPMLGEKLAEARESSANYHFEDGVYFGSYRIALTPEDIADPVRRSEIISESIARFYNSIKDHSAYQENGMFDFIYGTEVKQGEGGAYYVALTYRNPGYSPDLFREYDNSEYYPDLSEPNLLDKFQLNIHQLLYLKSFYDANSLKELIAILEDISDNYIESGVSHAEFARTTLITEEFRDDYLASRRNN